jgi:hypothetical protein
MTVLATSERGSILTTPSPQSYFANPVGSIFLPVQCPEVAILGLSTPFGDSLFWVLFLSFLS